MRPVRRYERYSATYAEKRATPRISLLVTSVDCALPEMAPSTFHRGRWAVPALTPYVPMEKQREWAGGGDETTTCFSPSTLSSSASCANRCIKRLQHHWRRSRKFPPENGPDDRGGTMGAEYQAGCIAERQPIGGGFGNWLCSRFYDHRRFLKQRLCKSRGGAELRCSRLSLNCSKSDRIGVPGR